jgi:serine phosphatase RsbU (regulator of sigma subunit)
MVEADRPVGLSGDELDEVEVTLQDALLAERERAAFLAEASRALAGSLNLRRTVPRVLGLCVPRLATSAQVAIAEGRSLRCTGLAGADAPPLAAVVERPSPTARDGLARVLRTGRPDLAQVGTPDEAAPWLPDDELRAALLVDDGPTALLTVPLVARGTVFGALTLTRPLLDGQYDERELSLLEDLGQRAALAIDAARLYTERSHVATVLQSSLRPPQLPEVPGVLLAARYRPANENSEIGGDFYDVHGDGDDWSVVIGDVMGKGVQAAVLTGQARQAIRTAAIVDRDPAAILRLLNASLLGVQRSREAKFATVAVSRVRPRADATVVLDLADAGHPPPAVVRSDGRVELVGDNGVLVGVFPETDYRTVTVTLHPGDLCLMYTDGVTEARGPRGELGQDGLLQVLPTCAGMEPGALVEHIEQTVMEHLDGAAHDDIALLALGVPQDGAA